MNCDSVTAIGDSVTAILWCVALQCVCGLGIIDIFRMS